MKRLAIAWLMMFFGSETFGQTDTRRSCKFCPKTAQLQHAGNIGLFSAGTGYDVLDKRLRLLLIYGYVPESITFADPIHLLTFKTTLRVYDFDISNRLGVSPYVGGTATFEPGDHSVLSLPDYFPEDYYGTTAFHFTMLGGLRLNLSTNINGLNQFQPFVEAGLSDTMFGYKISNRTVPWNRIMSAALGISITW
jgi:hypothetical protein